MLARTWLALRPAARAGAFTVHLRGTLGAGKTTLARGVLTGLGHEGVVRSPTYTLVEPYTVSGIQVFHLDLYRLADPEELEFLGARDCLGDGDLCLVEWPERGEGWLPAPDLDLSLAPREGGRELRLTLATGAGRALAKAWLGADYLDS
jgi:tRNA threonylcarbamoyladenosine biosynthesis protein TsaE